jgi:hypothetical protein
MRSLELKTWRIQDIKYYKSTLDPWEREEIKHYCVTTRNKGDEYILYSLNSNHYMFYLPDVALGTYTIALDEAHTFMMIPYLDRNKKGEEQLRSSPLQLFTDEALKD